MPVFGNPNYKPPVKQPKPPQQQGPLPAWMQGNNASQYVSANVGQGNSPYNFTPGYGTQPTMSGPGTVKILHGSGNSGVQLDRPTLAPRTMSATGTVRRGRGSTKNGVGLDKPQAQTYVANPQTYTAQNTPAWLQNTSGGVYMPGGLSQQQQTAAVQQLQQKNEKPYRIQNPDGSWAYLQADGTYLSATGTAGQVDIVPRNSFVNMPPLLQLQPQYPPMQSGYSPFGSQYRGWGRGGGGGYGYSQNPYTPSWMMGLNSWNFGE